MAGSALATHLVARYGVAHVVMVSRSGPDADGVGELIGGLEEAGAQVTVATCDVANRDAVAALIAQLPTDYPLKGVFHAAGVLDDGLIASLTPERLNAVLKSQTHATAASTVDAILKAVTDFQAGTDHFDDETVVVLRVL